jgi:hypothetical protein
MDSGLGLAARSRWTTTESIRSSTSSILRPSASARRAVGTSTPHRHADLPPPDAAAITGSSSSQRVEYVDPAAAKSLAW